MKTFVYVESPHPTKARKTRVRVYRVRRGNQFEVVVNDFEIGYQTTSQAVVEAVINAGHLSRKVTSRSVYNIEQEGIARFIHL